MGEHGMPVDRFVSREQIVVINIVFDRSDLSGKKIRVSIEFGDAIVSSFAESVEFLADRFVRGLDGNALTNFFKHFRLR